MLRATVRRGRTVVRPDHPGDYAVTIEGEIPFHADDAEGVLEKISELFHLADEALDREIDRDCDSPKESRTEPTTQRTANPPATKTPNHGHPEPKSDVATPKQVSTCSTWRAFRSGRRSRA